MVVAVVVVVVVVVDEDDVPTVVSLICVLLEFCCSCLSLLAIGIGSSLVSMMLVEAMDELKNLEVISLMRPLLECDAVTLVTISGVTLVVETVVVGTAAKESSNLC